MFNSSSSFHVITKIIYYLYALKDIQEKKKHFFFLNFIPTMLLLLRVLRTNYLYA